MRYESSQCSILRMFPALRHESMQDWSHCCRGWLGVAQGEAAFKTIKAWSGEELIWVLNVFFGKMSKVRMLE